MTGLLTSVMHEHADTLPAPDVDLDAIVAEGERQVRRQRLGGGLVAAAVAGAVAAGALTVPLLLGGSHEEVATQPTVGSFRDHRVTYAVGQHIYWGDEVMDVARPVASLVPTDNGFVYTTSDGTVWFFDGVRSDRVGAAEGNRLRADDNGSVVAWVELADDGHPQYVVYDTAARRTLARVDDTAAGASVEPGDRGAEVFAVDDGSVYWRHDGDLARYDLPSARESVLAAEPGTEILDVSYGTLAYSVDRGPGQRPGAAVQQVLDPDAPVVARASNVLLSPNARYLAAEEDDDLAVYDVRSGEDVTPDTRGYPFAVVVQWVDADTATVLAVRSMDSRGRASGDVLRCDIGGECAVAGGYEDLDGSDLIPPVGDPMT